MKMIHLFFKPQPYIAFYIHIHTIWCQVVRLSMRFLRWMWYMFSWNHWCITLVQYRHLIPAPVDRTSACDWSFKHLWITYQRWTKHRVACDPKLRLIVRSFMHPCPGNWVAIGRAVVYYARADQAFSAGIKCRHCSLQNKCHDSRVLIW